MLLISNMKIRMEIPDSIYIQYKELAEKYGFAVTKLNQILFKEAIESWMLHTTAKNINTCESCGDIIDKESGMQIVKETDEPDFMLWEKHYICEDCFRKGSLEV